MKAFLFLITGGIAALAACNGQTLDVGETHAQATAEAPDAAPPATPDTLPPYSPPKLPADTEDCTNHSVSKLTAPPAALTGTWLLTSLDDGSGSARNDFVVRYQVDLTRPTMAIQFNADGTYVLDDCATDVDFSSCKLIFCSQLVRKTGTYDYKNGTIVGSKIENWADVQAWTTVDGGLVLAGFVGTFEWANFVKIDTQLPSAQ
jgi:hypothetical protein